VRVAHGVSPCCVNRVPNAFISDWNAYRVELENGFWAELSLSMRIEQLFFETVKFFANKTGFIKLLKRFDSGFELLGDVANKNFLEPAWYLESSLQMRKTKPQLITTSFVVINPVDGRRSIAFQIIPSQAEGRTDADQTSV
jgi:hypothetical protein